VAILSKNLSYAFSFEKFEVKIIDRFFLFEQENIININIQNKNADFDISKTS